MPYSPSKYVKEELPTWAEIHEWHDGKWTTYDPVCDMEDKDFYWKIPIRLKLLALCCNQFNKMILEDGYDSKISKLLKDEYFIDSHAIFFELRDMDLIDPPYSTYMIYSLQERYNPFIQNPGIRKVVDPHHYYRMNLVIIMNNGSKLIEFPVSVIQDVYEILCAEVEKYFREPIGWKDEDGNLISDKSQIPICQTGFDPAL